MERPAASAWDTCDVPARDVFICHASPDKVDYARPLAASLSRHGVSSWLDEAVLQAGDSITDAISDGLRLASYVVVVVTPELLERPWPRKELNAAFSREVRLGEVVIIPVLAADPDDWAEAFPLLADKLYLRWNDGPDSIAAEVARRFHRTPAVDWVFEHPTKYVGPVWLRCTPMAQTMHKLTVRWGPLIRTVTWTPTDLIPWSLVHHKINPDQVPVHVNVNPAAIITVGQGPAPDALPNALNIDEGWTRAAGAPMEVTRPPSDTPLPRERSLLADQLDLPTSPDDARAGRRPR